MKARKKVKNQPQLPPVLESSATLGFLGLLLVTL
jgi:hypothetical protein